MPITAAGENRADDLALAARNAVRHMIDYLHEERGYSREPFRSTKNPGPDTPGRIHHGPEIACEPPVRAHDRPWRPYVFSHSCSLGFLLFPRVHAPLSI